MSYKQASLIAFATLVVAAPQASRADCGTVPSHPHDGGAAFHRISSYITDQMRTNGSSSAVSTIRTAMGLCHAGFPLACVAGGLDWYNLVCPGCVWDHKSTIRNMLGHDYTDLPGVAAELFLDIWSNIHYGFVGRQAGFSPLELQAAATLPAAGRTDAFDILAVQLGIDLYDAYGYRPDNVSISALESQILGHLGAMCTDTYHVRYFTDSGIGEAPPESGIGEAPVPPNGPPRPPSAIAMIGSGVDNHSVDLLIARSDRQRFASPVNGLHANGYGWGGLKAVAGDFNGDGLMDIAALGSGVDGHSVDFLVALANGSGGYAPFANWRHADGYGWAAMTPVAGDFNGDGKWDLGALGAGVDNHSVDLLVATSTGSSFRAIANWRHADGFGWAGMKPIAGDFNGDGKWDFGALGAGVNNTSVDLLVATSTGAGFNAFNNWRHEEGYGWGGMKPVAGDFNGDGKWDFGAIGAGVDNHSVDLLVATSTGAAFRSIGNWRHADGYGWAGMKPVAGDFNGDGYWDIGAIGDGVQPGSIDLLVARSIHGGFSPFASWLHAPGYGFGGLMPATL